MLIDEVRLIPEAGQFRVELRGVLVGIVALSTNGCGLRKRRAAAPERRRPQNGRPKSRGQAIADFTRSGRNGVWRSRTPIASNTALLITAAVGQVAGSPPP